METLLPSPPELFRLYEDGELTREQLHAAMSLHAGDLVEEIVEARRNPVRALYENALSRRAAARLVRQHGEGVVRAVLIALSNAPEFPMARFLWNASHRDLPLSCLFRMRQEPVFRLESIRVAPWRVRVVVEYGSAGKGACDRQEIELHRDRFGRLVMPSALGGGGKEA